jgi:hypothetical protein
MPSRPAQPLDELSQAIEAHDWTGCADQAFSLLYPLPEEPGREIAREAVARYLPLLGRVVRDLGWPARIVDDPRAWYREHGRPIPDEPASLRVSDETWLFCLDALVLGVADGIGPAVRTAAWATAIVTAVAARALAVWDADDPEAVVLWRAGVLPPRRAYLANAAARAVAEREWWWVARRLAEAAGGPARAGVGDDEIAAALRRWRDHEYRLIPP